MLYEHPGIPVRDGRPDRRRRAIVLGYLLLRLVVYVNPVVPPLLIAVVVVLLLNPVVSALERRGLPRVAGAGIVYVLFLCVVARIVFLFLWSEYVDYGEELTQGSPV